MLTMSFCGLHELLNHPIKTIVILSGVTAIVVGLYMIYCDNINIDNQPSFKSFHDFKLDATHGRLTAASLDVVIQINTQQNCSSGLQLLAGKAQEIMSEIDPGRNNGSHIMVKINWIDSYSELKSRVSKVNCAIRDTLDLEPLPYLDNFRNPCWLEKLPRAHSNPYDRRAHQFEMMRFNQAHLQVKSQFDQRKADGKPYRMRCLPYYYIIGPQKSGTTDLYKSLIKHPGIIPGMAKEPHWWPRSRIADTTLEEYIDLYDQAAETIARSTLIYRNGSTYHPYVTGEATPELIWDNWEWETQPENLVDSVKRPLYITADHIYHVTPQAKIIAMLRDPVTRLWSDYNYFGHGWTKTGSDYHDRIMRGLKWLQKCLNNIKSDMDRRRCMYDGVLKYGNKYGSSWNPVARLRMGMYSEMLVDWYSIFPHDQILILKMEDYATDRVAVLNKIYKFLGLSDLPAPIALSLQSKHVDNAVSRNTYARTGAVSDQTLRALTEFYKPYNIKLAKLTENDDFLDWNS